MELSDIDTLLDAKLSPLCKAVADLEESNKQIVKILTTQARQDERIIHIQTDVDKCQKSHDGVYARLHELEQRGDKKAWDVVLLFIAALVGGLVAIFGGKIKGGG